MAKRKNPQAQKNITTVPGLVKALGGAAVLCSPTGPRTHSRSLEVD